MTFTYQCPRCPFTYDTPRPALWVSHDCVQPAPPATTQGDHQ